MIPPHTFTISKNNSYFPHLVHPNKQPIMSITIDDEVAIPCILVMVFMLSISAFSHKLFLHCCALLLILNFVVSAIIFMTLHLNSNNDGFHCDSALYLIFTIFVYRLMVATERVVIENTKSCGTTTETINEESTTNSSTSSDNDEETSSVTATTSDKRSSPSSVDDEGYESDEENTPTSFNNNQITQIDLTKCKHFTINVTGIAKNRQTNNESDCENQTTISKPQQLENNKEIPTTPNSIRKSIYDNKLSAIKDCLFAKLFETDDDDAIDNYMSLCNIANHNSDMAYELLKITIRNSIEDMLKPADNDDEYYDGIAKLADNIVSIMETDDENSTQTTESGNRSEHSNENLCIHDGIVEYGIEPK